MYQYQIPQNRNVVHVLARAEIHLALIFSQRYMLH